MARIYVRSRFWTVCKFLLVAALGLFVAGMVGWFLVYFLTQVPAQVVFLVGLAVLWVLPRRRP
jgi:preprotein translocase subunit Sss1